MSKLSLPPALSALEASTALLTFNVRPIPLHADYRPIWRVPLLALMLRTCCRGGLSSLQRLHILNWSVRTPHGGRELLAVLNRTRQPGDVLVRVEPTLNLVIDIAHGEGIVSIPRGDRVLLTSRGSRLVEAIDKGCLIRERALLEAIGKSLTEDLVGKIVQVGGKLLP